MRKKKLFLNTVAALLNQAVTLICGFILPRQILLYFGSDINGLVSSITQFLGFITLMDMGVGAVVQSTLYKPLASGNQDEIDAIMTSANRFFEKIARILIVYTLVLMLFYPLFFGEKGNYISTAMLVAAISISSIAQYFFGITNQLLLNADQKSYIQLAAQSVSVILNTIISVVLIKFGASINTVKFGAAIVLLSRPMILHFYVKKNYTINRKVNLQAEPIKQKWNGLAQHLATFVVDRTDVAVLTIMSTMSNVSIYYVYHLVVTGLYQLFIVMTTGVQSLLGDMYAKGENDKLIKTYSFMEWLAHTGVSFLFGCAGVLMVPFVCVYTKGVEDANYILPVFSWVITIAYGVCCLRGFYNIIIKAVGHYKETQQSAIIEAVLNIVISVALVYKMGLLGVAIGTLIAMSYRTIYFAIYLKNNILYRKMGMFIKNIATDFLSVVMIVIFTRWIHMSEISYIAWIFMAIKVSLIAIVVLIVVNVVFYRSSLVLALNRVKSKIR